MAKRPYSKDIIDKKVLKQLKSALKQAGVTKDDFNMIERFIFGFRFKFELNQIVVFASIYRFGKEFFSTKIWRYFEIIKMLLFSDF